MATQGISDKNVMQETKKRRRIGIWVQGPERRKTIMYVCSARTVQPFIRVTRLIFSHTPINKLRTLLTRLRSHYNTICRKESDRKKSNMIFHN